MKNFLILTENDISDWLDETGIRYHFPNKYKNRIVQGSKFIYYKGKLKKSEFRKSRVMDNPHYFGSGVIGDIYIDPNDPNKYYAEILSYIPFFNGVNFKTEDGLYLEGKANNTKQYWRGNSVREITKEEYYLILNLANIEDILDLEKLKEKNIKFIEEADLFIPTNKNTDKKRANNNNYYSRQTKKIGDIGESLIIRYLKEKLDSNEVKTLKWLSKNGITPGYDIEYCNLEGQTVCIEVKATTSKKFSSFIITINELNALRSNDLFSIILIADCLSSNPKIQILDKSFVDSEIFEVEPISFKVYKKKIKVD